MEKAIKKKWLAALRSGKYEKGHGRLKYGNKCCPLGVLLIAVGVPVNDRDEFVYEGEVYRNYPPKQLMEKLGLGTAAGIRLPKPVVAEGKKINLLSYLSDVTKLGFKEIADIIEQQL